LFVNPKNLLTTWDNFHIVASFLHSKPEPVYLGIFDWAKAYRQIPTVPSQWPYLMTKDFDGGLLLDTQIAFGGVAGCGSFGRPADAWKRIILAEFDVFAVFRWVDNNLFIKEINGTIQMEDIVRRSTELGVETNKEKGVGFQKEQKYIEFMNSFGTA
jgi:hypothetical protein